MAHICYTCFSTCLAGFEPPSPASNGEVRNYVRDKIRSGKSLIRSLHQRQQMIHRIATQILNYQREFLKKDTYFLRPLNMATVTDEVGVHETTVSRAIAGKGHRHAARRVWHEVLLLPRG